MLEIREEELNDVIGGTVFGETFGGSKFNVGDKVVCKAHPHFGVGTVVFKFYDKGWSYVVWGLGVKDIYTESELAYPILF